MKRPVILMILLCSLLCMTACGPEPSGQQSMMPEEASGTEPIREVPVTEGETAKSAQTTEVDDAAKRTETAKDAMVPTLQMMINDTAVQVEWENNESVQDLRELCTDQQLNIPMSMYGGFEQVGAIGKALPRNDKQTSTNAGDIVLYSGNQMVVFYGSNSWAYTRLGRIIDKTASEMAELLGNGDVTITLSLSD